MAIPPISWLSLRADVNTKEFQAACISLSNEIDTCIGNDTIPDNFQDLAIILNHVCRQRYNDETMAVVMMLMISAKSACQVGWFPQRETQELLALVDSMWKGFSIPESSLNNPVSLIRQVMERFYPFFKLGDILVSFEAKGLFVFQTEDISKPSCIIHPHEVSFFLNGKGVAKRVNISMDSGPQRPTDVTTMLNPGANLLQTIGCFGGSYFIVIAFLAVISLSGNPFLKDYVHSEVIESNSDCDIIVGPSRISLSCPISLTRIKLPVKGHVCKHLQCFDLRNYLKINARIPSWRCPYCNQQVYYSDIRVDQNMRKILEEVGCDAADVVISADGSWRAVTENDENVEAVPETTHDHGDPNSFLNVGPTVLDLTRDGNEMGTSGGTQVNEHKPCLSEIQGPSNNTQKPAMDYTMLNQSSASNNAQPQLPQTLNVFDVQQQFMNSPQVVNTQDSAARQTLPMTYIPTSSLQDRLATTTGSFPISMHAGESSQYQGSHVMPLGHCQGRTSDLMERWRHVYGNGTTQTQLPPILSPMPHRYAMQRQSLPMRSMPPAQERPMPSSSITRPQTSAVNSMGTSSYRPMQRHLQSLNPGSAVEQFSSHEFMNVTSANTGNWRPQTRMRGSLMPGSTRYDNMMIRPTQGVEAQTQTLVPPPQPPIVYNNVADEIQAFLEHPSYPNGVNETQEWMGSMPVDEDVGSSPSGLFWSMPPETW